MPGLAARAADGQLQPAPRRLNHLLGIEISTLAQDERETARTLDRIRRFIYDSLNVYDLEDLDHLFAEGTYTAGTGLNGVLANHAGQRPAHRCQRPGLLAPRR